MYLWVPIRTLHRFLSVEIPQVLSFRPKKTKVDCLYFEYKQRVKEERVKTVNLIMPEHVSMHRKVLNIVKFDIRQVGLGMASFHAQRTDYMIFHLYHIRPKC